MIQVAIDKNMRFASGPGKLSVNYSFPAGEISAIYGNSGAGKTSLLKIIAGLLTPEHGAIEVNGEIWLDTEKRINVAPQKRNVGFVFQDYALFPNMTVRQNLEYAGGKNSNQVSYLLDACGLQQFADQKPQALSGGQKQRVALARALMRRPTLLLLDEPLSATDAATRRGLQDELLKLHQEFKFTALLVSHDVAEIHKLASHAIELKDGKIANSGRMNEVFTLNNSPRIKLAGTINKIEGTSAYIDTDKGNIKIENVLGYQAGQKVVVSIDTANACVEPL